MASKERSPNFPALTLEKALDYIVKLHAEAKRTAVKTMIALQAMGFNSISGRSKGVLAALRAYGLLKIQDDTAQVTDLALRIVFPKNEQDCAAAKREAALSPKLFRALNGSKTDLSEKMLASELYHEGFTQEGAAKAAQIFHQNQAFTGGSSGDTFEDDGDEDYEDDEEAPDERPLQRNKPHDPPPPNLQPKVKVIAEYNTALGENRVDIKFTGTGELEPEDLDELKDYIEFLKRQLDRARQKRSKPTAGLFDLAFSTQQQREQPAE